VTSGNLVVVQCKRFAPNRRITSPMIQHFMAMALHHGAHGKIFATTSDFTAQAIALSQDAGVELIDGAALAALVAADCWEIGAGMPIKIMASWPAQGNHREQ
jgi:restriction system protein